MNSRNFIPEQTLLDRLLANDAEAFEEITKRYCFSLYSYCISKINSEEDAKRIVRNLFISLWEDRLLLPADFSLSLHLYKEVRKSVVQYLNSKLVHEVDPARIPESIIAGFRADQLIKAKQPVHYSHTKKMAVNTSLRSYEGSWWEKHTHTVKLKTLKHALRSMVNF